jgi:hypothetical protein
MSRDEYEPTLRDDRGLQDLVNVSRINCQATGLAHHCQLHRRICVPPSVARLAYLDILLLPRRSGSGVLSKVVGLFGLQPFPGVTEHTMWVEGCAYHSRRLP